MITHTCKKRAADIRDVAKRVLAHLLGAKLPNPATIDEESIVIAHDLTPSDTAQLNKQFVKALLQTLWTYKPLSYHGSYT